MKAPWIKTGDPERWISVTKFASLMKRSPQAVYLWIANGTITDFGYEVYRDPANRIFIHVTPEDLLALSRFSS